MLIREYHTKDCPQECHHTSRSTWNKTRLVKTDRDRLVEHLAWRPAMIVVYRVTLYTVLHNYTIVRHTVQYDLYFAYRKQNTGWCATWVTRKPAA